MSSSITYAALPNPKYIPTPGQRKQVKTGLIIGGVVIAAVVALAIGLIVAHERKKKEDSA